MITATLKTRCDACTNTVTQDVTKYGDGDIGDLIDLRLKQLRKDGWDFAARQGGTRCPTCSGLRDNPPRKTVRGGR